jgi:hypothetical protein
MQQISTIHLATQSQRRKSEKNGGGFAVLSPVVFFVKEVLASSRSDRFPAFLRTAWCILRLWRMPPFPSRSPCDNIESPAPNAESCLSLAQSTRMRTTNSATCSYIHLFTILYFSQQSIVYSSKHFNEFCVHWRNFISFCHNGPFTYHISTGMLLEVFVLEDAASERSR